MANRRMISKAIAESDLFIDMPPTSQLLYFHFIVCGDDDGFVSSPKRILRSVGCKEDDVAILAAKGFIKTFNSGVLVITHWHEHNSIRKDRYSKTLCADEFATLELVDNQWEQPLGNHLATSGTHSIGKVRLSSGVEDSIEEDSIYTHVFNFWIANTSNLPVPRKLTEKIKSAINGITNDGLTLDDINHSIIAYNHITNGAQYFFDYKWGLLDFLKREGGCRRFADVKDDKQYLKNSSSKSIIISEECPY